MKPLPIAVMYNNDVFMVFAQAAQTFNQISQVGTDTTHENHAGINAYPHLRTA
ncbi:MAG TPA: hypothetical protein QF533_03700 [Nitrospinota bacterium]|nr:hypothetical protein [Nitrospinota bacterium]